MINQAQEPIRLYTYANSPFGQRVYWALQFKNLKFDLTYVNPFSTKEISFTKQRLIPILEIGKEWRQDSHECCLWLEELFPERPFAGKTEKERETIIATDRWVTNNLIAQVFRMVIDKNRSVSKRNARRMIDILRDTSNNMPWGTQYIWHILVRLAPFVGRAANMLDKEKDFETLHHEILRDFERRIGESGFLAGTDQPSFADVAAFGQIAFSSTHKFEGTLTVSASPAVTSWYDRMRTYFPTNPAPSLYPTWPPANF